MNYKIIHNPLRSLPQGYLVQASDGMLYGMTYYGGANNDGVLFQYNPSTSTYTDKFDFGGANDGYYPQGDLMQASDGMLYGMTSAGGINLEGVLFQYNPATSIYTKKFDFGSTNGSYPVGALIQASDGMLYGLTNAGGTYTTNCGSGGCGTLFKYDIGATTAIPTHNQAGLTIFSYNNAIITNGTIPQGTQLKVFNALGQVVLTTALQNNIETNLPSGIYTMQVIDPAGSLIEIKKCAITNH
ncbi:MAG: choice-of-anchor tandem repeat GloVer-containing protein [Bacteroidia bacterium]